MHFTALMLLTQSGLIGVFCAMDALVFYFFWELALIPVYFLSSICGRRKTPQATFKFFVYTFTGSLLLLIGIIYVYLPHTRKHLFAEIFHGCKISSRGRQVCFLVVLYRFRY